MIKIHVQPPLHAYPSRLRKGIPRTCACGRPIPPEQRTHVCTACRVRKSRGHVLGPACEVCGCADRRVLRRHRLAGEARTLCANDSAIAGRRSLTLDELRAEVAPGRAA